MGKRIKDAERSIGKRWTSKLATRGFTPVVAPFLEFYNELGIGPQEAMLLVHVLSYKWDETAPFPSSRTLARRLPCSERNVRKLLSRLESIGILKRHERPGMSNQYDLSGLFRRLEELETQREEGKEGKQENVVPFPKLDVSSIDPEFLTDEDFEAPTETARARRRKA